MQYNILVDPFPVYKSKHHIFGSCAWSQWEYSVTCAGKSRSCRTWAWLLKTRESGFNLLNPCSIIFFNSEFVIHFFFQIFAGCGNRPLYINCVVSP